MNRVYDRDARIASLEQELASAREREQDLIGLIDSASLGLQWINASGAILQVNRALLEMLGYSHDEYVGHNIAEFHAGADAAQDILELLGRKEMPRNYEARIRAKDGRIRHVWISCNARWNHDELADACCLIRDVTDRSRSAQRLLAENGVARILSECSSLEDAAPALLELTGAQFQCRTALLWMPREDQDTLYCAASWEASTGNGCGFAAMSRRFALAADADLPGRIWRNKSPAWVADLEQDGTLPRLQCAPQFGLRSAFGFPLIAGTGIFGVMEFLADEVRPPDRDLLETTASLGYRIGDFVERTRAEQRLAEFAESYRVLTETASDGILTIKDDGTILFANRAASKMFGYASEELAGKDARLLIPEHLRSVENKAVAQYLEAARIDQTIDQLIDPLRSVPFTGLHRHGHEIPLEISIGGYRQGNRRVFVAVIRDISERKSLDETLRQTAKLESLGVLAGGIAHDFNNLLTGILGNVSLSIEMLEPNHPVNPFLRDASDASERAAHLTKQLLAYAGKGRFVVEPIDISALVREISSLVKSSIPEHVTLRLDLEQPLPLVEADTAQIQQLVMNLVINAAEAIPKERHGTVLVTTRFQEVDALYIEQMFGKAVIVPGPYLVINVHDNGIGMDGETLGKIFDPFFTTKFTGRGLGLAAAMGIVRGHKGALKVFSNPGQGTTFKVLLPVTAAPRPEFIAAVDSLSLSGIGGVLVVDDEPVVRKAAASALERYGYRVITAEDGREGVECFRELHHQLAAVILDMTMPVMSGEEALHHMRLIDRGVPVILSSGYNEVEAIRRFAGKGLAGFLQKPYTAKALAEKIRLTVHGAGRQ